MRRNALSGLQKSANSINCNSPCRPDKHSAPGNLALPSVSVNQVTTINPAAETEPAAVPGWLLPVRSYRPAG
ncbi:hypothetical protein BON98_16665 [Escherichia coli]|nr:hypothetical protein ACN81_03640 [Escherichia coli]OKV32927.1 hypothetical protein AWP56_26475 [Escherichia coli]OKV48597.1 hypothetical protein AWP59_08685 [Escherichia coli]OKV88269.1 hypothetical protein AWP67_19350 [Escherichia coli]OKX41928.1 hypothetical protein AWP92_08455 [Escherichia coli]